MLSLGKDGLTQFLTFPWLEGVDLLIRERIWRVLQVRSEIAGLILLEQDRPIPQLWFVAEGAVIVERDKTGYASSPEILTELAGPAIYGTTTFFRNSMPTMTIRATSPIRGWTLDRSAYEQLRVADPFAAEALALMVVKVLSERFDMLDSRLSGLMTEHRNDHRRVSEWAEFRSRLFDEPAA